MRDKFPTDTTTVITLRALLRQAREALTREYVLQVGPSERWHFHPDELMPETARLVEEIDDELAKE